VPAGTRIRAESPNHDRERVRTTLHSLITARCAFFDVRKGRTTMFPPKDSAHRLATSDRAGSRISPGCDPFLAEVATSPACLRNIVARLSPSHESG
jgi:hypothetical protein